MARSTEDLQAALVKMRDLSQPLKDAQPVQIPPRWDYTMYTEIRKVHDFCELLLDEVLELREGRDS